MRKTTGVQGNDMQESRALNYIEHAKKQCSMKQCTSDAKKQCSINPVHEPICNNTTAEIVRRPL